MPRGAESALVSAEHVRLSPTQPFDWPALLGFFRTRAVAGVEDVGADAYRRSIAYDGGSGHLTLRYDSRTGELIADVAAERPPPTGLVAARLRRHLDLDADLAAVGRHLARDPALAAAVARRPAVRIPGFWDPFETALRAILGQQVSLAAARVLAARLVERAGPSTGAPGHAGPHRLFPAPAQVLAADLSAMGMPGARVRTLQAVAEAALADPDLFRRGPSLDATIARLLAIKGIGPWTAHYIALRACREPDAFPAGDVGLLRGMAVDGRRPTAAELGRRAEAWRPFRAYAAHHIWAGDAGSTTTSPDSPDDAPQ